MIKDGIEERMGRLSRDVMAVDDADVVLVIVVDDACSVLTMNMSNPTPPCKTRVRKTNDLR